MLESVEQVPSAFYFTVLEYLYGRVEKLVVSVYYYNGLWNNGWISDKRSDRNAVLVDDGFKRSGGNISLGLGVGGSSLAGARAGLYVVGWARYSRRR